MLKTKRDINQQDFNLVIFTYLPMPVVDDVVDDGPTLYRHWASISCLLNEYRRVTTVQWSTLGQWLTDRHLYTLGRPTQVSEPTHFTEIRSLFFLRISMAK